MNDWLKDGFETGYISEDYSAAGQLKKLEEKRIDELRQYVAYQQAENDRKERQAVIVEQFVCSHQFSQPFFIILCRVFITNICGAGFAHPARPQTVNVFSASCNHGERLLCSAFMVSQKPPFKVARKGQKSAQKRRGSN